MKKMLFAGFLLATIGTATMSAKTTSNAQPTTVQSCVITYITETQGNCVVTYKVCKYYCCGIEVTCLTKKCEIKRVCGGTGGGEG